MNIQAYVLNTKREIKALKLDSKELQDIARTESGALVDKIKVDRLIRRLTTHVERLDTEIQLQAVAEQQLRRATNFDLKQDYRATVAEFQESILAMIAKGVA